MQTEKVALRERVCYNDYIEKVVLRSFYGYKSL